jgi:hypothetical protein
MVARTSIATILHFPSGRPCEPWVPRQARQSTVDDIEFYWLKPIQHLCNYGPPWAGREAWVTYGGGRIREMPANAAKGSRPLLTLLPRHNHMRIVRHYHASYLVKAPSSCSTCLTSSATDAAVGGRPHLRRLIQRYGIETKVFEWFGRDHGGLSPQASPNFE